MEVVLRRLVSEFSDTSFVGPEAVLLAEDELAAVAACCGEFRDILKSLILKRWRFECRRAQAQTQAWLDRHRHAAV